MYIFDLFTFSHIFTTLSAVVTDP